MCMRRHVPPTPYTFVELGRMLILLTPLAPLRAPVDVRRAESNARETLMFEVNVTNLPQPPSKILDVSIPMWRVLAKDVCPCFKRPDWMRRDSSSPTTKSPLNYIEGGPPEDERRH
jgi:hypothetical protein